MKKKFKLPRQLYVDSFVDLILREIKKQKLVVTKATQKNLAEMKAVSHSIKKEGLPKHLVIRKLEGQLGDGVFLHPKAEPIRKGQVIAPYAGELHLVPQNEAYDSDYAFAPITEIILKKEDHARFDLTRKFHPRRVYSLDLDASKQGNFTRFINHSEEPNIEAHLLRIPENSLGLEASPIEIVYIAKKTIRPGEQLLVCYEDEEKSYWGAIKIKPFPMKAHTFRLNESLEVIKSL